MKYNYAIFIFLIMAAGCSKSGGNSATVTPPAPSTDAPAKSTTPATATTNASQSVWHLTSLSVNNIPQTLTSIQSEFVMVLSTDYRYSDTDGIIGNWSSPSTDSLVITQTNLPTTIKLRYKIMSKTNSGLSLTMGSGASQINLGYEAR